MHGISALVALLLCGASAVVPGTVRAQAVGMSLILIAISEGWQPMTASAS